VIEHGHVSVLADEVVDALNVRADGIYVDATYGRGGHSRRILAALGPAGRLLAMDRDPDAIAQAKRELAGDERFAIEWRPFSMLGATIDERGWRKRVNGILFDLGVSSPQLDDAARGFSFQSEGPLDMRMDPSRGESAADWLASAPESDIADVLHFLGEERFARRIARAIVNHRSTESITTTRQLAELIRAAVPTRERHKDPATRSFQAIRLHVNRELDELRSALPQAVEALMPGGRLAVISFHSLEDRIVKQFMRDEEKGQALPPDLPIREVDVPRRLHVLGRAVRASDAEVERNPRSRSAVLRVAETPGAGHA